MSEVPLRPSWLALVLFLGACRTPWSESVESGLRLLELSRKTSGTGALTVDVPVDQGDGAMLLTVVVPEDTLVFVERLVSPDGRELFLASEHWTSPYTRTYAAFSAEVVVFNWPINALDAPLTPGWWQVDLRTRDPRTPVEVSVVLKRDEPKEEEGILSVNMLFAGDLADDNELIRGTTAAIDIWRDDIYAPIGIDVETTIATWEGPEDLLTPGRGDADDYLSLSLAKALDEVNVVVVDRILDGPDVLGVSGGIPGALVATGRSAVAASALEAAGSDRTFSDLEEQLLAETLAHEVGHYLGLFHPVELPTETADPDTWDSLADTSECLTMSTCEGELADNLMYPSPVCDEEVQGMCSVFVPQTRLTAEQAGVAHHYTGVR